MKKMILLLFLSISWMVTGCAPNPNYDPEVMAINTMIQEFTLDDYHGFEMVTTQYDAEENILNNESWIQLIDRTNPIKIMTEVTTQSLQPFNVDHMFVETTIIYYYYNNQKGTQIDEGSITWEETSLENYQTFRFPIRRISKEYFKTYDISIDGSSSVLHATLNTNYMDDALDQAIEGLQEMSFTLTFSTTEKQITHVMIHLGFELTQIVIEMTPLMEPVQVIIPNV